MAINKKIRDFKLNQSMFWAPEHLGHAPAWMEHGPFAFWIIDCLRPKKFVELGTHAGFSYFCFCQAVKRLKSKTACIAVDTWKGDEHAGFYDEGVFNSVLKINKKYQTFSELYRLTFDEALEKFPSKSIDLLHIDGRHFYEDVKHDYESWLPKLTDNAIVLFHDTNVHERDFGVWKLFKELKKKHTAFEFLHGHGLGVLAPKKVPAALKDFFASNQKEVQPIFASLGSAISTRWALQETQAKLQNAKQLLLTQVEPKVRQQGSFLRLIWKCISRTNSSISKEERSLLKSIGFNSKNYLVANQDVNQSGIDPRRHYLDFGKQEGRSLGFAQQDSKSISKYHSYYNSDEKPVPLLKESMKLKSDVRLVAFYLPQFHPIPENDLWWGKGFTEWTNVTRAVPQFEGHYQPHLPGELGFYDLRNPDVQRRQSELADIYGISAFCIYFYWFNGKVLLEKPLQNLLANLDIKKDFCLCWANENWTRRWDGNDQDVLMPQHYSAEDDIAFIKYISKFMRDKRYLKMNGRHVLLIYRPQLFPSMNDTAKRWREWCLKNGVGELYLVCTNSFGTFDPKKFGCDAAVEFPPNNSATQELTKEVKLLNSNFSGHVYDWSEFVSKSGKYKKPNYTLFRSVCPSWDNEARKPGKGHIFINSSPMKYCEWLKNAALDTVERIREPQERLVFVNAWNEWAEGAHLEPDRRYGYAYLEASRVAQACAQVISSYNSPKNLSKKVAIVVHVFYLDVFEKILDKLSENLNLHDLFLTTTAGLENQVRSILNLRSIAFKLFVYENRGRDVLPFISVLKQIDPIIFPFVLKLHTKKSVHRKDGAEWLSEILDCLASPVQLEWILEELTKKTEIGLVGPKESLLSMATYLASNHEKIRWIAGRLGVTTEFMEQDKFIAGTMFVARRDALEPLLHLSLDRDSFENEAGQLDGTMAHAIERAITYSVKAVGLEIAAIETGDAAAKVELSTSANPNFSYAKRSKIFSE